jgi:hypothetical protein
LQQPNGKTTTILLKYPALNQLYHLYCRQGTPMDSCRRLKRTLAINIVLLHRVLSEHAHVSETGQKLSATTNLVFAFGGQVRHGQTLTAAAYLDALASVAERVPQDCFTMLEHIAISLLHTHHPEAAARDTLAQ